MKHAKFYIFRQVFVMQIISGAYSTSKFDEFPANDYTIDENCLTPCSVTLGDSYTGETKRIKCEPVRHTKLCVEKYSEFDSSSSHNKSHCPESLVVFEPEVFPYTGSTYRHYPVAQLNMSAIILDRVDAVRMELECVKWEQNEDLCIGNPDQGKIDKSSQNQSVILTEYNRHWPCRLFDLKALEYDNYTVQYPASFHYTCLRAKPFTQFRLNVSLYPQNCESSYFMTIPDAECIGPDTGPHDWQPLLIVDTSYPQGVWVRLTTPPYTLDVGRIIVTVKLEGKPGVHLPIRAWTLDFTKATSEKDYLERNNGSRKSGHLFEDLPRGKYSVEVAFLDRDKDRTHLHCQRDLIAYFWLIEDKFVMGSPVEGLFQDWSLTVGLIILGLVVAVFIFAALIIRCCYKRKRQMNAASSISMYEFPNSPRILILYTDDSTEHRECVLKLASFLQLEGQCQIMLDEWALVTPGQAPDHWLFNSLEQAEFYVVVFSEGTKLAFQGQELFPRRHWMELFNPGVTFVLQELLNECRQRSPLTSDLLVPYIWIRFAHSDQGCVEPFLNRLPVPQFVLPDDLRRLLCHVHRLPFKSVVFPSLQDAHELEDAVYSTQQYYRENADWLAQRLNGGQLANGSSMGQNRAISSNKSFDMAKLAADLRNLDLRTLGGDGITVNVAQAFARFRNERNAERENDVINVDNGHLSNENYHVVDNLTNERRGGTHVTEGEAVSANQRKGNDYFELLPPEEEEETKEPLVPKYEVLGCPDDEDSD